MRTLTEQELEQLRMPFRHVQASRLKDRYQVIRFSHLGRSVQEIARFLDVSEDTVRKWIHTFEEDGFDGLADDYRSGRPPKAAGRYIERLTELIHISPLQMGYLWTGWTLELLMAHMEKETGARLCGERVRQLLLMNGIRFRRAKLRVVSDDPLCEEKKERIEKLLAAPPERTVVLFEDKTEIHLNPRIQRTWQEIGSPMKVDAAGKDRKLDLFGAVNPGTGTLVTRFCKHKRGSDFVAFLRQVADRCRGWHVKIVLDNYSIHFTRRVRDYLEGLDGRVELVAMPTYSPHLNPIKGFWLFLKSHVLSNHLYSDLTELKKTV